jgi:hypothetical protein
LAGFLATFFFFAGIVFCTFGFSTSTKSFCFIFFNFNDRPLSYFNYKSFSIFVQ